MNLSEFPSKNQPLQFTLDDGSDEIYMIGSQAGAYMGLFRGAIYKKFPYIWRRLATNEEKPIIQKKFMNNSWKLGSSITLVKAIEIVNILKGYDQEYVPRFIPITKEKNNINDTRLNLTKNESMFSTNMNITMNEDTVLTLNDFNIFAIPICNLIVDKKVEPCHKKIKTSSIYLNWKFTKNLKQKLSNNIEELIPIRLFLKLESYILNDVFFWNKSTEDLMDYNTFSELLCDDIGWPKDIFVEIISNMIKKQVEKYDQDKKLFQINKDLLATTYNIPVVIQIDINIGNKRLIDKFEWDITKNDVKNCKQFALILVKEMNLSPEFIVPIAVSILGQINWNCRFRCLNIIEFQKNLNNNNKINLLQLNDWSPKIIILNNNEILLHQKNIEKKMMF